MRFCPIEHQFIHESFHKQMNESSTVSSYNFRHWEPGRALQNFLE
jgi:hypothetical protein